MTKFLIWLYGGCGILSLFMAAAFSRPFYVLQGLALIGLSALKWRKLRAQTHAAPGQSPSDPEAMI